MKTIITIMLAFIVSAASAQKPIISSTFKGESGWMGSNITSTSNGDIYIYKFIDIDVFNPIMSLHNGILKVTDTLATINELLDSYILLDSLLKRTQLDYYAEQKRNYNTAKNIQLIIKQGRAELKKMKLIRAN